MEELDMGLEALIEEIAMENDIPEYNKVKDTDSIAVKNAKLAAQAKANAGSNPPPSNTNTSANQGSQNNNSNSGSILWKNRQKAY